MDCKADDPVVDNCALIGEPMAPLDSLMSVQTSEINTIVAYGFSNGDGGILRGGATNPQNTSNILITVRWRGRRSRLAARAQPPSRDDKDALPLLTCHLQELDRLPTSILSLAYGSSGVLFAGTADPSGGVFK